MANTNSFHKLANSVTAKTKWVGAKSVGSNKSPKTVWNKDQTKFRHGNMVTKAGAVTMLPKNRGKETSTTRLYGKVVYPIWKANNKIKRLLGK